MLIPTKDKYLYILAKKVDEHSHLSGMTPKVRQLLKDKNKNHKMLELKLNNC